MTNNRQNVTVKKCLPFAYSTPAKSHGKNTKYDISVGINMRSSGISYW